MASSHWGDANTGDNQSSTQAITNGNCHYSVYPMSSYAIPILQHNTSCD